MKTQARKNQISTRSGFGSRSNRIESGSSMLELPATLWLVFITMFIPMIALAAITFRSTLFGVAAQDAAHAGARARTFETATAEGQSAIQIAQDTVTRTLTAFPGMAVTSVDNDIIVTDINSGSITRSESRLSIPADTSRFIYQLETTVRGQIDPLIGGAPGFFGNIPGLTGPIQVAHSARQMFENPQGLNR